MAASRRVIARAFADQLQAGASAAELVRSLAAYLIVNKQHKQADMVTSDIVRELAARGRVLVQVTTARPLAADQKQAIEKQMQKLLKADTIELDERVDPDVIGGAKIALPDRELDASVKRQLQMLRGIQ